MKKIISILLVGLLMLQGVAFADYQLGTEEDVLTLSGTAEPYEVVSFVLLNSDNLLFLHLRIPITWNAKMQKQQ